MRDPLNWSIPLFRMFGIQVRLHILYIIVALGMLGRQYYVDPDRIGEYAIIWIGILFGIVLLHEFGHCFAARSVDGEAEEILMWPLGGLAFCSVPQTPRANFICVAGGPAVNLLICLICGVAMIAANYLPPVNIFQTRQLYQPELRNWSTGETAIPPGSDVYFHYSKDKKELIYAAKSGKTASGTKIALVDGKIVEVELSEIEIYPAWVLWSARVFWLSWLLFCFNMIPAYPMDGGRLLQVFLWSRSDDYRGSTTFACYSSLAITLVFLLISFVFNDSMLVALAIFIAVSAYQKLYQMQMEEQGSFGYDFSKGYGGFGPENDDETPTKKVRRPGPIKRWLLARKTRKERIYNEQVAADDRRLDELLAKIKQFGNDSVTPEERRFMERVSNRYKNR
jgi:Zn-dependent protease